MAEKIRLNVLGLTYSQIQSGAYALILAQADGPYRIPVVVGAPEAQSIALKIENITPPRPLTHDLFESFVHAFGIRLNEVFIYKFDDGIFYSELEFTDGERIVRLDCRTSDAIAIAIRMGAPIYTTRAVIEETGVVLEESESTIRAAQRPHQPQHTEPKLENLAVEELEAMLARHIEREEYEQAAAVQQIINRKKGIEPK